MAKLAFILFLLPFCAAKIRHYFDDSKNELDLDSEKYFVDKPGSAWVVDFKNGLDRVVLRQATEEECEMLRSKVGGSRASTKQQRASVKKDDPVKSYETTSAEKKAIENELRTVMNKFLYAIRDDPDNVLSEPSDNGDSYLTVFFQNTLTCLTVTTGRQQWNYVVRPSPLPAWFYEDRPGSDDLHIPEEEKYSLYQGLLSLIRRLSSHPA